MRYEMSGGAIVGAREDQQDCAARVLTADGDALLVVADGMGGHVGGEIASGLAVEAFVAHFEHYTRGPLPKRLEIALAMANQALAALVRVELELDGMGTTLLAAHLGADGLHWTSVGDSPLLLVRDGLIARLNQDHSMVPVIERLVTAGRLTRAEADSHPERSALLSVLTGLNTPDIIDSPAAPFPLREGDWIIAASDGILTLALPEIARLAIDATSADTLVAALLGAVTARGQLHQDNATVEVVRVGSG
ncbi:MAG: serine/threonine-protein phosphatase [Sphingomonadales bacterium]|nr:serine/threonine-protein phosphatase [Sphingomonadales bacterium]